MKLIHQNYGKAKVRILKVLRTGQQHSVKELEVQVMLQGNFEAVHIPKETTALWWQRIPLMKNTVNVLAKKKLGSETEVFGVNCWAIIFLKTYRHVSRVEVILTEHCWNRIFSSAAAKPHTHSFAEKSAVRPLYGKYHCD